jgi:hypothetical protein
VGVAWCGPDEPQQATPKPREEAVLGVRFGKAILELIKGRTWLFRLPFA